MALKSGATQDLVMESVLTLFFREITFTKNFVKMISRNVFKLIICTIM